MTINERAKFWTQTSTLKVNSKQTVLHTAKRSAAHNQCCVIDAAFPAVWECGAQIPSSQSRPSSDSSSEVTLLRSLGSTVPLPLSWPLPSLDKRPQRFQAVCVPASGLVWPTSSSRAWPSFSTLSFCKKVVSCLWSTSSDIKEGFLSITVVLFIHCCCCCWSVALRPQKPLVY